MNSVLSVSQLYSCLRTVVEGYRDFARLLVAGEVSNLSRYERSGHLYFTLRDGSASIRTVIFKSQADRLKFAPQDGMRVVVIGKVTVYERDSSCQIIGYDLLPDGAGQSALLLRQLTEKLGAEGLFDEARKRPLPRYPEVVGVVTSKNGAAFADIRRTVADRCPSVRMLLSPATVQGALAPQSIAEAIARLNGRAVDVVIVARGGGASEDLAAFNTELVARAIAACPVPVISAVGHEIDVTLSDLAADARASTPTLGAIMAVPDRQELSAQLTQLGSRLHSLMRATVSRRATALVLLQTAPPMQRVGYAALQAEDKLEAQQRALHAAMRRVFAERDAALQAQIAAAEGLSPLRVLLRGYAIALKNGRAVRSSAELAAGDLVDIRLAEGSATAEIRGILKP